MEKIVLIIPTLKQGGAERVMSIFANYLVKSNFSVHLILLAKSENFYKVSERVNIYNLGFSYTSLLGKALGEIVVYYKLRYLLRKLQPCASLSFMEKFNSLNILASLFLSHKCIISDRSNPNVVLPFFTSVLKTLTYRFANGFIAQTNLSKDMFAKSFPFIPCKVIPNPTEIKIWPKQIPRERIILNIGRLVWEKDQRTLINIFHKLNLSDWHLVILGEGPLKDDLNNLIFALGLQERVHLKGAVTNVDEWIARASIFCFTSISEGFPNALLEAMVSGLPSISFACNSGPSDIIEDGHNGFLVDLGNLEDYIAKVRKMVEDDELREKFSLNSSKLASIYSSEVIASEYLNFIKELK